MRITTVQPAQVARAYGITSTSFERRNPAGQPRGLGVGDRRADLADLGRQVNQLVAGVVTQPIAFDATATPVNSSGTVLPLYIRAADKVEAAVGVHLGRTIDLSA